MKRVIMKLTQKAEIVSICGINCVSELSDGVARVSYPWAARERFV